MRLHVSRHACRRKGYSTAGSDGEQAITWGVPGFILESQEALRCSVARHFRRHALLLILVRENPGTPLVGETMQEMRDPSKASTRRSATRCWSSKTPSSRNCWADVAPPPFRSLFSDPATWTAPRAESRRVSRPDLRVLGSGGLAFNTHDARYTIPQQRAFIHIYPSNSTNRRLANMNDRATGRGPVGTETLSRTGTRNHRRNLFRSRRQASSRPARIERGRRVSGYLCHSQPQQCH